MARGGKGRSGRRYVRDAKGRFASKGAGATARGGRLKTASGKKRATQTMKVSGAKAAGTISKPKGLKPGTIKAKPQVSSARQAASKKPIAKTSKAPVNKAKTEYKAARADARMRNADLRGADVNERRMANTAAAKVKNMQRRRSASVPKASADSPRSRQTAKQIARRKRAAANERQAYDRWDKGMATDKDSRKASVAKRARAIYEGKIDPKVKTRARLTQTRNPDVLRDRIKRGEKLTAAKAKKAASKRRAAKNAERKAAQQAASARPARVAARTALKRTGRKVSIPSLKTNTEKGRKGIVSMSTGAKQARRGAVAERKAERRARVAERQSGIVARRQNNRLSTYLPSGAFNQAAQNLNQSKLKKSKQIQSWLTTRNPADKPQSRRRKRK